MVRGALRRQFRIVKILPTKGEQGFDLQFRLQAFCLDVGRAAKRQQVAQVVGKQTYGAFTNRIAGGQLQDVAPRKIDKRRGCSELVKRASSQPRRPPIDYRARYHGERATSRAVHVRTEGVSPVRDANVTRIECKRLTALMDDALPVYLGENRVVIGWSALDIAARADNLIAARFQRLQSGAGPRSGP